MIVFLLNSDDEDSKEVSIISSVKVLPSYDILKSSSRWLNDCLINAAQSLLKAKFPGTLGLQDVGKPQTCSFVDEGEGEFVQIINCFNNHWVCVTNKNCKQNKVRPYHHQLTNNHVIP